MKQCFVVSPWYQCSAFTHSSAAARGRTLIACSEASLAATNARCHVHCHWSAPLPIDDCFYLYFLSLSLSPICIRSSITNLPCNKRQTSSQHQICGIWATRGSLVSRATNQKHVFACYLRGATGAPCVFREYYYLRFKNYAPRFYCLSTQMKNTHFATNDHRTALQRMTFLRSQWQRLFRIFTNASAGVCGHERRTFRKFHVMFSSVSMITIWHLNNL